MFAFASHPRVSRVDDSCWNDSRRTREGGLTKALPPTAREKGAPRLNANVRLL